MSSTLDTVPRASEVTLESVDAWAVDFGTDIDESETIASANAVLYSTASIPGREVEGFVTDVSKAGTTVTVTWTGESLVIGGEYILHTIAVLDTGARVVLLTAVRCVG